MQRRDIPPDESGAGYLNAFCWRNGWDNAVGKLYERRPFSQKPYSRIQILLAYAHRLVQNRDAANHRAQGLLYAKAGQHIRKSKGIADFDPGFGIGLAQKRGKVFIAFDRDKVGLLDAPFKYLRCDRAGAGSKLQHLSSHVRIDIPGDGGGERLARRDR